MEKFVIQWHLTHKCNLRCKHCYQEDYEKDLELREILKIYGQLLDFLRENNYKGHINFTGGEPLLSDKLECLMGLCDKNNITYGILTNGTLIDESKAKWLSTFKNLKFVQVSLDGGFKVHDEIRGEGSIDKALSALKLLKKHGIETMVSFTASKKNFRELKTVIRLSQSVRADRFWTDRLVPIGGNELDIMTNEEFKEYLGILEHEIKKSELGRKLRLSKTYIHNNRAMQFLCGVDDCRTNRRDSGYKCSAGKNLIAILADGTLLPCRRLPIELGNLTTENLGDILKNSKIISELKEDRPNGVCENCINKSVCNKGAKCLTYSINGDLHGKDINCMI